jgi:hypothetical protein
VEKLALNSQRIGKKIKKSTGMVRRNRSSFWKNFP